MTPEQRGEARRYGRWRLALGLADKTVDVAWLAVAAFFLAQPLDAWLGRHIGEGAARLAALLGTIFVLHALLSLPLAWLSGHWLEKRFGLSKQSGAAWLWRWTKAATLSILFGLGLMIGLFWIIRWTGAWWWAAAAGAFFVVSVILGQLAPVLVLPLFYKVQRLDDPELRERLERLLEGARLRLEGVYRLGLSDETVKANAMLTGLGRTRRVLMGDTLLEEFTPEEIEVVFAHEVGHHVFGHIPKLILAGGAVSLAAFWLTDRLTAIWLAGGGPLDYAAFPAWGMLAVLFFLTAIMFVTAPLQNALSRRFERQCDRYALRRTNDPIAYRQAFQKLARQNKADPDPNPLEVLLFHSHPPISERLAMADEALSAEPAKE